jgi:glycosyltransferase involved in cell wall biosynthesis
MRVLYAVEAFEGGVFESVRIAAEGLAERGHDAAIAFGTRPETPREPRNAIAESVELFPMPWTRRRLRAQLEGARRLRHLATEWQPDVVHLYSAFAGFEGAVVLPAGMPTVFTPQAYAFTMRENGRLRRLAYRLGEGFASRRATVVGACSQSEAALAREVARAKRVQVVANGIPELDDPPPPPRREPSSAPNVVCLGRTVPQRQPEACAKILTAVADRADVAWIGGTGGSRGETGLGALRAAGIQPSGWLPRDEVMDRLGLASAYLHWTAWDGLPLSVLEAMALDVVVVASDIPPNRELLGDRQVCGSEQEAIDLLREVLEDPQLAAELRQSQRRRRGGYGAQRMVDEWLDIYRHITN